MELVDDQLKSPFRFHCMILLPNGINDDNTLDGVSLWDQHPTCLTRNLRGCELVLEANPQDIEFKQRVLGAVEHVVPHASICGAVDVGVRTQTVSR